MKPMALLAAFLTGTISGFALAAWSLYEPLPVGPAKYTFTRSAPPVPPYAMDGTRKIFQIACISESTKDCPQPAAVPEPGTLWLMGVGLLALGCKNRNRWKHHV